MINTIEDPQTPNRQGGDPLMLMEMMAYYRVPAVSIAVAARNHNRPDAQSRAVSGAH
jgi:hypothetical protein